MQKCKDNIYSDRDFKGSFDKNVTYIFLSMFRNT